MLLNFLPDVIKIPVFFSQAKSKTMNESGQEVSQHKEEE
jgi:hypothetical protein